MSEMGEREKQKRGTSGHMAPQPRFTQELHGIARSQRSFRLGKVRINIVGEARTNRRHSAQLRRVAPFLRFLS